MLAPLPRAVNNRYNQNLLGERPQSQRTRHLRREAYITEWARHQRDLLDNLMAV